MPQSSLPTTSILFGLRELAASIIFCTIGGFTLLLVVERKNTPLEEIAKYFDGDNALVGGGVEMAKKEKELISAKEGLEHVENIEEV